MYPRHTAGMSCQLTENLESELSSAKVRVIRCYDGNMGSRVVADVTNSTHGAILIFHGSGG